MAGEMIKMDDEFSALMGVSNLSTTLDITTAAGAEKLAKALSYDNPTLDKVINTELQIEDIVVRDMGGVNDKTGEVETYKAIVLVCADGRCFFTGANGVRRSLFLASISRGKPPWHPPLRVIVRQRSFKGRDGNPARSYSFEVISGDHV